MRSHFLSYEKVQDKVVSRYRWIFLWTKS